MDDGTLPEAKRDEPRAALLSGASERRELEDAFAPWRHAVHRHLVFRSALDGLTVGAVAGVAFAGGALLTHHHALRYGGLVFAAAGAIVGAVRGAQRAWSDERIALYVDGVLQTPETVTSAIVLGRDAPGEVVGDAVAALLSSPRRAPGRVRRRHGVALAATLACLAMIALRPPKPASAGEPTGTDVVKLDQVPGVDKIAEVEKLPAKDEAQKKRLDKIAEDARELKKKLQEGMPRRDALDKLKSLKQRLDAEKQEFGGADKKAGLDAAANALKQNGFPGLADALEDRDLQSFDEMMERIANQREDEDRQKAHEALEKAIEEAKKKGADDVAKQLEKEKQRLEARKDKSDVLKELADALKGTKGDPGSSGKSFDSKGTDGAAKELADALRKGLEKLSPEERKQLADRLKEQAGKGGATGKMSPQAKKKLEDLAKKLQTPEGQKELEDELRDLANSDPSGGESDEEKQQDGLDDGQDGADDLGKELGDKDGQKGKGKGKGKGKKPGEKGDGKGDGDGDGKGDGDGDGNGNGATPGIGLGDGDGSGGPGPGGGVGDHKGKTKKLDAATLKAKAKGVKGATGQANPNGSMVKANGVDGASETVKSGGDGQGTPADEVNGVDKADVPEGVRRQVKSYFE